MFDLIFHPRSYFKRFATKDEKICLAAVFIPLFLLYISPFCMMISSNKIEYIELSFLISMVYIIFFLYSAGFYKITLARNVGLSYFLRFPATFIPFILLPVSLTLLILNYVLVSFIVTLSIIIWSFILEMILFKEISNNYSVLYHLFIKILKDLPIVIFFYRPIFHISTTPP